MVPFLSYGDIRAVFFRIGRLDTDDDSHAEDTTVGNAVQICLTADCF